MATTASRQAEFFRSNNQTPAAGQAPRPAAGMPPQAQAAPAGNFSAYRPGQAQSQQSPYAQSSPYGQNQGFQMYGQAAVPLPTFQFRGTDFMGNQYDNPGSFTAQQGATANALNAQRAQQINTQQPGRLDPFAAYQQGQRDIQGGFVNPFAQSVPPQNVVQSRDWNSLASRPIYGDGVMGPSQPLASIQQQSFPSQYRPPQASQPSPPARLPAAQEQVHPKLLSWARDRGVGSGPDPRTKWAQQAYRPSWLRR